MRMTRVLAIVVAAIASFSLVLSSAPANAEPEAPSAQAGFAWFNTKVNDSSTAWVSKGKAITWKRKIVLIQRKPENGGSWKTVKRVETGPTGGFRTKLQPRKHIPCTGTRFKTRAKKKGRAVFKVSPTVVFCS